MKYVLTVFALLLLPMSVPAMMPLEDAELDQVSGQSGVSILPNITMDIHFDVLVWGDSDGIGGSTSGGYVGVAELNVKNLSVGPRTEELDDLYPKGTVLVGGIPVTLYDTRVTLEQLRNPSSLR